MGHAVAPIALPWSTELSMVLTTGMEVNQDALIRPMPRSPAKDRKVMKTTTYCARRAQDGKTSSKSIF
jgi:hypothetical protein